MTVLVAVPKNNPIPDATNTPVETTESFNTIVSIVPETLLFPIAPISYEPKTVLQDIIDYGTTYKAAMPHPKKFLLLVINIPINILTFHLQDHQHHYYTAVNINPSIKAKATIKTHRFHKVKNHMVDV